MLTILINQTVFNLCSYIKLLYSINRYVVEICINLLKHIQLTGMRLKHVNPVICADSRDLLVNPRSSVPPNYERGVLVTDKRRFDLALDEAVVRFLTAQLQPVTRKIGGLQDKISKLMVGQTMISNFK